MVRTRGLGRALGRVIGRALGRKDHHDSYDVPQRPRPTASARRQREVAPIAEDDPMLTEDIHAYGEEVVDDAEGFLGRPHDPSVLTDYGDLVAVIVWNGELSSHGRKVQKFGRSALEIERLVAATGLSPLIACSVDTGHQGLISAFVERWHKETSSFHLPVRELTITLDDVASLLHPPIIGAFHSFEPLHVDKASGSYAWGAAALVHIYDHLNDVCKSGDRQLADYDEIPPCACQWIAMKASLKSLPASTYRKCLDGLMSPNVCWMPYGEHHGVWDFDLISCFSGHLQSGPVVVRHRPERVVRQFGYVQTIPPQTTTSMLSFEDIDNRWMHYSDYLAVAGQICIVPGQCASDYMEWFFMISHPFMTPAEPADLPRHPPAMQDDTYVEPYIPEVPVAPAAAPAHAPSYVEQPHTVEACQAIAERLDRLLNLRIVTAGTKIHEVVED
ncbi:uncharacterized protein LOC114398663 [Glycine soja]|uniref:uncharacterized protein LOC114398663 n=1 Tax=Glycine soja TaxID=3848 RepID=UPI00103FD962|nr:uncharacterized protein LOC114398663 [Glycine soja]